ncbi:MAG: CBS domain-containing protein [Bdellovibrio sp.]|nr:CBS domain-containing protein [Bdellovibrio sp.]
MKFSDLDNITVFEYTSPCDEAVQFDESIKNVEEIMNMRGVRHMPVLRGSEIVGIISQRDMLLVSKYAEGVHLTAEDVMSEDPYIVDKGTPLSEVAYEMSRNKIGSAVVQDQYGRLLGIFTTTDALNALVEVLRGEITPDTIIREEKSISA